MHRAKQSRRQHKTLILCLALFWAHSKRTFAASAASTHHSRQEQSDATKISIRLVVFMPFAVPEDHRLSSEPFGAPPASPEPRSDRMISELHFTAEVEISRRRHSASRQCAASLDPKGARAMRKLPGLASTQSHKATATQPMSLPRAGTREA